MFNSDVKQHHYLSPEIIKHNKKKDHDIDICRWKSNPGLGQTQKCVTSQKKRWNKNMFIPLAIQLVCGFQIYVLGSSIFQ